jgi:hypothetical protein
MAWAAGYVSDPDTPRIRIEDIRPDALRYSCMSLLLGYTLWIAPMADYTAIRITYSISYDLNLYQHGTI